MIRFFFLERYVSRASVTMDDKITFNFQVLVKMPRDNHPENTAKTPCLDFIIGSFQNTDIKNFNSYEMLDGGLRFKVLTREDLKVYNHLRM